MDGGDDGDDDDGDSSGDDADDKADADDEDGADKEGQEEYEDEEEEEEHLAPVDSAIVTSTVELVPHLREHSLLYHHPPLTLLPLELGSQSGFRLPYPF
ncbi:hypothetical protein Tco_0809772, partial [Tanacetum coccineum]